MSDIYEAMQKVRDRVNNPFLGYGQVKPYIDPITGVFNEEKYKTDNGYQYALDTVRRNYNDYSISDQDVKGFINPQTGSFDLPLFTSVREYGEGYKKLGIDYTSALNFLNKYGEMDVDRYKQMNPYYDIEQKTPQEFTFDISKYKYDQNDPIDEMRQARGVPPKSLLDLYDFTESDDVKLYQEGKLPRSMGGFLKSDSDTDKLLGGLGIEGITVPEDQSNAANVPTPEEQAQTEQDKQSMNDYFMDKYGYEVAASTPMPSKPKDTYTQEELKQIFGEDALKNPNKFISYTTDEDDKIHFIDPKTGKEVENFWTNAYNLLQGNKAVSEVQETLLASQNPLYGLYRSIVASDNDFRKQNVDDSFMSFFGWLTDPINKILNLPFTVGARGAIEASKEKGILPKIGGYFRGMGKGVADTLTKNDTYDTRRMFEELLAPKAMATLKDNHPILYEILAGVMQYVGPDDLLPGIGYIDDVADAAKMVKGTINTTEDMLRMARINQKALASFDDISSAVLIVKNADDPAAALSKLDPPVAEKVVSKLEGEKVTEALDEVVPEWRNEMASSIDDALQPQYAELNGVKYYDEAMGPVEESALAQRAQSFERMPEEAATKLADEPVTYQRSLQEVAESNAQKVMQENDFELLRRNVIDGERFSNATEATVARNVFDELLNKGRTDEALEVLEAASKKFTKAGQVGNAAKWWNAGPTGVLKMAENILKKNGQKLTPELTEILTKAASELDAAKQTKSVDGYIEAIQNLATQRGIKITNGDVKFMKTLDVDELDEIASAQLAARIYDEVPSSVAKKASTVQAFGHLLNLRTLARNVSTNIQINVVERATNAIAMPIDWAMSLFTGRRTIGLTGNIFDQIKFGAKRGRTATLNTKLGTFNLLGAGKYDLFQNRTFNKGLGKRLEDALGVGLRSPDEFSKGMTELQVKQNMAALPRFENASEVYKLDSPNAKKLQKEIDNLLSKNGFDSLNSLYHTKTKKAIEAKEKLQKIINKPIFNNWDELLKTNGAEARSLQKKIEEIAAYDAQYATLQNNTWPGVALQGFKELLNRLIGVGPKVPGQVLKQTRAWGLGDFVVKYTRVPGAIIARTLDYSPGGAVKAVWSMFQAKDIAKQRKAAQMLARSIVGTLGIYAAGKFLHNKGLIFSSNDETNKDIKNILKQQGLAGNTINMSAIGRWIKGGDLERQDGDQMVSLGSVDIFGPMLAIGAEVDRIMKIDDPEYGVDEKVLDIAKVSFDTILDMSMMYVLNKIQTEVQAANNGDPNAMPMPYITVPLAEGLPGFVWSGARQVAQVIDPVYRETYADTWQQEALNKIVNNIPVLREQLNPQRDVFGEPRTSQKEAFGRFIDLAVNPMYVSSYKENEISDYVINLSKETGDESFIPRTVSVSNIQWKVAKFNLTQDERNRYQHIEGNIINQLYGAAVEKMDNLTGEEKAAVLKELKSLAEQVAKAQIAIERYDRGEMDNELQPVYDELKNNPEFQAMSQVDKIDYLYEILDYMKGE